MGQRVFGFVTLARDAEESVVAGIVQNVSKCLASYKIPEDLRVLDALPRNALGKVERKMLQAMVCKDKPAPSSGEHLPVRRIA